MASDPSLKDRLLKQLSASSQNSTGHDLRNPLASISAAGRVLAPEVTSERGKQVLQLMAGSVSRMSGLIDNVLVSLLKNLLGRALARNLEANMLMTSSSPV